MITLNTTPTSPPHDASVAPALFSPGGAAPVAPTPLWKTAASASLGAAAGGIVGSTCGALAPPMAGLSLIRAGQAVALFGPPLAFVSTLATGEMHDIPLWASVPAACAAGASAVPAGVALGLGGLAWLAASPILSPLTAVATGALGAVTWGVAGAKAAN